MEGTIDHSATVRYCAVEVKRHATIESVEQITRYRDLLDRDPLLNPPIRAMLAAQSFTAQAKTLAADRGIECVQVDYDELRGLDSPEARLF